VVLIILFIGGEPFFGNWKEIQASGPKTDQGPGLRSGLIAGRKGWGLAKAVGGGGHQDRPYFFREELERSGVGRGRVF